MWIAVNKIAHMVEQLSSHSREMIIQAKSIKLDDLLNVKWTLHSMLYRLPKYIHHITIFGLWHRSWSIHCYNNHSSKTHMIIFKEKIVQCLSSNISKYMRKYLIEVGNKKFRDQFSFTPFIEAELMETHSFTCSVKHCHWCCLWTVF